MKLLRQGDVMLRKVGAVNTGRIQSKKDAAVAYGEHSGHAHIATQGADVFEIEGKMYVVTGRDGGLLEHLHLPTGRKADHNALVLEPDATYEVIMQNQYNPYSKLMEQVID